MAAERSSSDATRPILAAERPVAPPSPDAESQPFWDAAREGRFLVKSCNACGRTHWFPRTICPFCWSADTAWRPGSGRGRVYSYTVMRRARAPYVVAYVTLEEGPRMLTNIVECDPDAIRIDQEVELVFVRTTDDGAPPVPMFRPAG